MLERVVNVLEKLVAAILAHFIPSASLKKLDHLTGGKRLHKATL